MSATIAEKSRRLSGSSGEIIYVVKGTANEVTALNLVNSTRPSTLNGLVASEEGVSELYVQTGNDAISSWLGTASYGKSNMGGVVQQMQEEAESRNILPQIGDTTLDFKGSTYSQTILYAKNWIQSYPSKLVDYQKGINVDPETHKPQGSEILLPTFSFTATKIYNTSSLTLSAINTVRAIVGMVNADIFTVTDSFSGFVLSFAAGEVLFDEISLGRAQLRGTTAVGYGFKVVPNETSLTIGGISSIKKKGWELASVYASPYENDNVVVQKATQVDILQVYTYTNFSILGLS